MVIALTDAAATRHVRKSVVQFQESKIKNFGKVSKRVHEVYDQDAKLWVFFNTKRFVDDGHAHANIDLTKALHELTDLLGVSSSSIQRRQARGMDKSKIMDETDVPVQESLVNAVLECGHKKNEQGETVQELVTLYHKSKWLNSISISIKMDSQASNDANEATLNDVMHCITALKFVDKVDMVAKFYRPLDAATAPAVQHKFVQELGDVESEYATRDIQAVDVPGPSKFASEKDFYSRTYNASLQVNVPKTHELGMDGSGITILICDSGFLTSHEAFKSLKIVDTYDFINNGPNVTSPWNDRQNEHGTATLSTIAGYNPHIMVGPAYNAQYLLAKTEDVTDEKIVEEDNWVRAIEWGEGLGAELVSSSLGYTLWYHYVDMTSEIAHITRAADMAVSKGVVVVSSVGNDAEAGPGAPADGKYVISVGAVDLNGVGTSFTSRGPAADGRVKPEISALGYKNFVASFTCNTCYTLMSGTSFSCPLAAGSIALVMQRNPTWTPKQVYRAVVATASQRNTPNKILGYGILNTFEASRYVQDATGNEDCRICGCLGGGKCGSNGACTCPAGKYGNRCEYNLVSCGNECIARGGSCSNPSNIYTCVSPNALLSNISKTVVHHVRKNVGSTIHNVVGNNNNNGSVKNTSGIIVAALLGTITTFTIIGAVVFLWRRRQQRLVDDKYFELSTMNFIEEEPTGLEEEF
ncbi:hypothetical protein SAMD00019534_107170 [Acytostelium subglobosum LB1]|uniref:hypothetical protein n=1 Tax=Acytostelium subglobosum LB1 TaxID=1410327 RepID=UPI000644C4DE|nr:hypothetical protein SAMD00019534_107170 [Acytostelium subglobosum LB1]GAM27541.1 hypothetical protein SAMD00019534_107170 [Acytostelium subglobosum LB1]|eukprot:XP_012749606.1 hypothetical protein SAMD00019534_107170 [Acytostelium subglobosum LB1]